MASKHLAAGSSPAERTKCRLTCANAFCKIVYFAPDNRRRLAGRVAQRSASR